MELGTGIFLSAILLGLVWLYTATKDRWNWKKLTLWPMGILFGLAMVGGGGLYVNDWIENRPYKETGFWGIQLGASPADVKFIKGKPNTSAEDYLDWITKNEHLKGTRDFDLRKRLYELTKESDAPVRSLMAVAPGGTERTWLYSNDNERHIISLRDGKVRFIIIYGDRLYLPTIQGIGLYSSPEDIVEKFGQPSYVSSSKDGLRRWFSFAKFNVAVAMEKNVVMALAVYDASTGPIIFSDDSNAPAGGAPEKHQAEPSTPLPDLKPPGK